MKLLFFVLLLTSLAFSAAPIVTFSVSPNTGTVGSVFTITGRSNFHITSKLGFMLGGFPINPISSSSCSVTGDKVLVVPASSFNCSFIVPSIPLGKYAVKISIGNNVFSSSATNMFIVADSSLFYDSLLAKVPIGFNFTYPATLILKDGVYQFFLLNSDADVTSCSADKVIDAQIKYQAFVSVSANMIVSASRGVASDPILDVCLNDEALNNLLNSTNVGETVRIEMDNDNLDYNSHNFMQGLEMMLVRFYGSVSRFFEVIANFFQSLF